MFCRTFSGWVGIVGEGLSVGDHHIHLVIISGILQLHPPAQGTYVMADVEFSGGGGPR